MPPSFDRPKPRTPETHRLTVENLPDWLKHLVGSTTRFAHYDMEADEEVERVVGELAKELIEKQIETARALLMQLFESLPALPYDRARGQLITTQKMSELTGIELGMTTIFRHCRHWFPNNLYDDFAHGRPDRLTTTRDDIEQWKNEILPKVVEELLQGLWRGLERTSLATSEEERIENVSLFTATLNGCLNKLKRSIAEFPSYQWKKKEIVPEHPAHGGLSSTIEMVLGQEFDRRLGTLRLRVLTDAQTGQPYIEVFDETHPPQSETAMLEHRIWPSEGMRPSEFQEIFQSLLSKAEWSSPPLTPAQLRQYAYARITQLTLLPKLRRPIQRPAPRASAVSGASRIEDVIN